MSTVQVPQRVEPARAPRSQPRPIERPELRVVDRRRRRPSTRRVVTMLAITVFSMMLFSTVAGHVMIQQQQQRLDRLTKESVAAQASYSQLRLQVDTMQSPARIVAEAQHLGLVQPATQHFLTPKASIAARYPGADSSTSASDNADYPQVKPFLGTSK